MENKRKKKILDQNNKVDHFKKQKEFSYKPVHEEKVLLSWVGILRVSYTGGDLCNVASAGFGFLLDIQDGVSYGKGDEEASNGHGGRSKGQVSPLVQHTTRVMSRWPP